MDKNRKVIKQKIEDITYILEGDLNDVIAKLIKKRVEIENNKIYSNLCICNEKDYYNGAYYDDFYSSWLYGDRLENDKEYEVRIKKEKIIDEKNKKNKQTNIKIEKSTLKRLMKKYPKNCNGE